MSSGGVQADGFSPTLCALRVAHLGKWARLHGKHLELQSTGTAKEVYAMKWTRSPALSPSDPIEALNPIELPSNLEAKAEGEEAPPAEVQRPQRRPLRRRGLGVDEEATGTHDVHPEHLPDLPACV